MSKLKIVIVDDDQEIVSLIKDNLEVLSVEVIASTSSEWVLQNVNFKDVDCLITDILMPEIDGVELVKRIYQNGHHPELYFITGYSDYPREFLNQLNPKAIIFKPFDVEEACIMIKNHLEKK